MRVLQLNFERGWRGGERQTLFCLRQLRAAGHQPELLARAGQPLAQAAQAEGFVVHTFNSVPSAMVYLLACARGFDILHAQTANTLTWLAVLKPLMRRPVVFTRRTAFPVTPRKVARTSSKWRRVDAFVAISEAAAAEPRRLGFKVSVIRSAIEPVQPDTARMQAWLQHNGLQGRVLLGTAAALTREKDPLTLIRAVHHLRRTHPHIVFVHFGADGDVAYAARQLVRELGLAGHYRFAGFEPQVERLFGLLSVFALSSVQEALGSSVLDAFSQRVPVVATAAGGLKESLADGRGVLCDIADFRALAAGMARLLDDQSFREQTTTRAANYVAQEHDVAEMGRRYVLMYQALCGSVA